MVSIPCQLYTAFIKRPILNERHRIGEFCKLDCMFFKHQYHEYNQELQNICALIDYPMYSLTLWFIFMFEMIRLYATILLWRPSLLIMKMHVPWVKKRSVVMKKERGEESNDYFSIRDDKRCNVLDSPYFWTLSVLLVYCSERNPSARTGR